MSETVAVTAPVTVDHPLAMLTGDEVRAARSRSCGPTSASAPTRRSRTSCCTSRRRPRCSRGRRAIPSTARCGPSSSPAPGSRIVEAIVSVTAGELRARRDRRGDAPGAALRRVDRRHGHGEGAPGVAGGDAPARASPTSTTCRSTRGRRASFGVDARGRPPHQPLHLVPPRDARGQRLRPADRGRASCTSTSGAARCSRSSTTASCRCRPSAARYLARRRRAAAHRPQAARDHPARGPELHRRRQPRPAGSSWSFRVGFDPVRGPRAAHGRRTTTAAACGRSCTARRSREMVVPYGDPGPDARLEERVRRGRVGPRPDGATRSRSAATASARSTTSTRCSPPSRASRTRSSNAICMHEEDYGILWKHRRPARRHRRGAPVAAPRRQLHRHRRQLRVRLLLVLLPRRQHPARGEAHRHHVADGDRARRRPRASPNVDRARARGARTTSTCSAPGSTSTSTAPTNAVYEVEAEPRAAGPDNPWAQRVPPAGHAARRRSSAARRDTNAATQPALAAS